LIFVARQSGVAFINGGGEDGLAEAESLLLVRKGGIAGEVDGHPELILSRWEETTGCSISLDAQVQGETDSKII
jgi:hypothetical protein